MGEAGEKVQGLVHDGGRNASRAKNGSGPEAAKWLPLPGLGGRWQVAAGQGRTSAVLAVAGRVWAPDFYRVAGRTGPRNTMRLGAVTAARQRHSTLLEGHGTRLSHHEVYIDYTCTWRRAHPAVSESFKVPIPQRRGTFSPWESCSPQVRSRGQVPGCHVPGYFAGHSAGSFGWPHSSWANQILIRHDDQQQTEELSLPAKPPPYLPTQGPRLPEVPEPPPSVSVARFPASGPA